MQFKYCPQSGSLEHSQTNNRPQCRKCRYAGRMDEGPMDKINEIRKRAGRVAAAGPSNAAKPNPEQTKQTMNELAERLKSLKGKSTEDAEFL